MQAPIISLILIILKIWKKNKKFFKINIFYSKKNYKNIVYKTKIKKIIWQFNN